MIYLLDSSGFFSSYTCANAEGFILSRLFKYSDHKTQVQYKLQFFHLLNQMRPVGGLEPLPAVIWREAGYTMDKSPVNHKANKERETDKHFH